MDSPGDRGLGERSTEPGTASFITKARDGKSFPARETVDV